VAATAQQSVPGDAILIVAKRWYNQATSSGSVWFGLGVMGEEGAFLMSQTLGYLQPWSLAW